jgi:predicted ATP-grasp superfamily ATP-dependent carboligase
MPPARDLQMKKGPILVLDPGSRLALATVRGLGRAGWRVIVAGSEPKAHALAAQSKYAESYHRIPDPWGEGAPVEAALLELVRGHGCQVVVLCHDGTIARLRDLDVGAPTVPRMDHALDRLTDKISLGLVCAEAGVMYPRTWSAEGTEAIPLDVPIIVKPRRTAVARPDRVFSRTGAFVAHDRGELDAASELLRAAGLEPIVQIRVERALKVNVSIVRRAGQTSFRIAYRVLLEYPPEGGMAAAIESLDPLHGIGARALEAAERVCDAAGYAGLANIEFYGQGDGQLCLIEVNARVWGSIWFPERLGLRPVERAVEDALGNPPMSALPYRAGRRFHRPTLEARWVLSSSEERGSIGRLLAYVRPWDVFDMISMSDPVPLVHGARRILGGAARDLKAAIIRRGHRRGGRTEDGGPEAAP